MEKFLKFMQQYVQWIALGIGGLYLLLMAYSYLLGQPITRSIGKESYLPGELDEKIQKNEWEPLQKDISSQTAWVTPKPVDVVHELQVAFDRPPNDVRTEPAPTYVRGGGGTNPVSLTPTPPIAPAPTAEADTSSGTSVAIVPQPVIATLQAAGAAPAANPAAPAAPAVNPVAAAPVTHDLDLDWWTLKWTIGMKGLNDAFSKANIPAGVHNTALLKVEIVRQELYNGAPIPGSEKTIEQIPTYPIALMPSESAAMPDKVAYLQWAITNAQTIATPLFFQVRWGTKWYAPGAPKGEESFPTAPVVPGAAPAGRPIIPPRGGPQASAGQARRATVVPVSDVFVPPRRGIISPGQFPIQPGIEATEQGKLPAGGLFDPATPAASDITIYTHDWTVEAGHSYQYKMHYWIKNPLFNVLQGNKKPAGWDLLAIKSADSDWTKPIDVPSRYKFWIHKSSNSNIVEPVTFDLFKRKPDAPNGIEFKKVPMYAGDALGGSSWLLVDVRQDNGRTKTVTSVLVSDPNGHVESRNSETDFNDPDHLLMLDKVK